MKITQRLIRLLAFSVILLPLFGCPVPEDVATTLNDGYGVNLNEISCSGGATAATQICTVTGADTHGNYIQSRTCNEDTSAWGNWGDCTLISCNGNYQLDADCCTEIVSGSSCTGSQTQNCTYTGGHGSSTQSAISCNEATQEWNWGSCMITCETGYTEDAGGICQPVNNRTSAEPTCVTGFGDAGHYANSSCVGSSWQYSGNCIKDGYIEGPMGASTTVAFLHRSTGGLIYDGGVSSLFVYPISERLYPSGSNYPQDYYEIWADPTYIGTQDKLDSLTLTDDVIIFKHCYPVTNMVADTTANIDSPTKSMQNYMLQYEALKVKMHSFPQKRFIVWTAAVNVRNNFSGYVLEDDQSDQADRARNFVEWVKNTWDEKDDNIFIWDFYEFETDGWFNAQNAPFLVPIYSQGSGNSHPNTTFSAAVAPYFVNRITEVIEGKGDDNFNTSVIDDNHRREIMGCGVLPYADCLTNVANAFVQ